MKKTRLTVLAALVAVVALLSALPADARQLIIFYDDSDSPLIHIWSTCPTGERVSGSLFNPTIGEMREAVQQSCDALTQE